MLERATLVRFALPLRHLSGLVAKSKFCGGKKFIKQLLHLAQIEIQFQWKYLHTLQKCNYFNPGVVISVASIQWDVHLDCMHDFSQYT